ncbi:XrtB/PEP-CTERM-associated transcriptional regulator EpsA [Pelomonas sp. KK5]|uniref:XrtB/PEP-CTERM-associated transcriptional regulator EpsA n=1 Tax=Pelomonas sp. KK5 TaxID=1855730 RepID=UPI00097C73D7|nr:XrtB/PEP-CTERM-associated transcriptional regulator EpsA [Pelomonas sp. KK5]
MSPAHVEAIVRAAESALEVCRRYQFFVWTQGNVQLVLPHQLTICGAYQRQARELVFDAFNSVSVPEGLLEAFTHPRGALMQLLQGRWLDNRCHPVRLAVTELDGPAVQAHRQALQQAGFVSLVAHGLSRPQRPSEMESFFVFGQQGSAPDGELQCHTLELLMPHIHATWHRVQVQERELRNLPEAAVQRSGAVPGSGITGRERQILGWLREGMSNQEIGEVLGISALTVKNHVQKILRKLNAANRAQAVARAMTLNLLDRVPVDVGRPD